MLRKSLLDEVGVFDESMPVCEDYDLWLRICARLPVLYVNDALVLKFGGHEDQLSKKFWGMDRFRIYSLEKLILESNLSKTQTQLALNALIQKIRILILGGKKRGNFFGVNWKSFPKEAQPPAAARAAAAPGSTSTRRLWRERRRKIWRSSSGGRPRPTALTASARGTRSEAR